MNFRQHEHRELVELNLTPLIDVVFLLLIFFMVSTTFQRESELRVQLPKAENKAQPDVDNTIELVVNGRGQYFVNGKELVNNNLATVRAALQRATQGDKKRPLIIRPDKTASVQSMVTAMDAAAQLGLLKMSIATAQSN